MKIKFDPNHSVDTMLELINDETQIHCKLFANFKLNEFISMECWPSLASKITNNLFIWLFRPCLINSKLRVDYKQNLSLGNSRLLYLYSDSLHLGYLIDVPKNYTVELTPTYLSLIYGKYLGALPTIEDLPELEHLLNGQHLSVFALGTMYIIGNVNNALVDFLH